MVTNDMFFCEMFFQNITQSLMCGEALSCTNTVCERDWSACKSGTILFFNNDAYHCPVTEYFTGP